MADREAKVRFRAETAEFQSQIKAANGEMQGLRSEMKLADAQFSNTGDRADYLKTKSQLLESQLDANRDKQAALSAEIEVASSIYGEDSEEVANLEKQLNYAAAQEQQLESQLSATNAEMEASETATGQLTSTIAEQEGQLDQLKQQYVEAVLAYGENSDEAQRLAGEITSLSGELEENRGRLEEARSAADGFDQSIAEAGEGTASAADTMAEALAGAGVAQQLQEIGQAAVDMASDFDDASATIVEGTGATGDALAELESATVRSFANMRNADASLNDVAGVVAELNTRLGITGDEASETADKVISFAHHVGTDAVGSVDSIVDVMHRWGLEESDLDALLDDLVTSNQACALSVDDFTGYLTKNSAQFQELGYSVEDSLAFLTSLSDGGANVGAVMQGLTKTITNLSGTTDDVPGAFRQAIDAISECDTVSEALNAEVGDTGMTVEDVFGKKAAQEIATCVQNGNFDIARFSAALEDNQGILEQTATDATTMSDEMSRATNNVAATFDTIFGPAITDVCSFLADLAGDIGDVVRESPALRAVVVAVAVALGVLAAALAISSLIQAVTSAFGLLNTTLLANPIFLVVVALTALVAGIMYAWNNCEAFRTAVTNIWEAIRGAISGAINGAANVIRTVMAAISSVWSAVWGAVSTTAANVWNGIRNTVATVINAVHTVISSVLNAISAVWSAVWGTVSGVASNVWNGIRNTISTAINAAHTVISSVVNAISSTISGVFNGIKSTVSNVWNGIKDAMTGPINTAKDTISGAIDTIKGIINGAHLELPKFKLPHFRIDGGELPWGIGGKGRAPSIAIDWYARGGILTAPTIFGWDGASFMGGGEAGPEAVLPIDALQGYIDAAFERNMGGGELVRVERAIDRLRAELPRTIAENAPDSWPGDRSFRTALRNAGVAA